MKSDVNLGYLRVSSYFVFVTDFDGYSLPPPTFPDAVTL